MLHNSDVSLSYVSLFLSHCFFTSTVEQTGSRAYNTPLRSWRQHAPANSNTPLNSPFLPLPFNAKSIELLTGAGEMSAKLLRAIHDGDDMPCVPLRFVFLKSFGWENSPQLQEEAVCLLSPTYRPCSKLPRQENKLGAATPPRPFPSP